MTPFPGRGFLVPSASHLVVATSAYRRPAFGLLDRQDSTVGFAGTAGGVPWLSVRSWGLLPHSSRLRPDFQKTADPPIQGKLLETGTALAAHADRFTPLACELDQGGKPMSSEGLCAVGTGVLRKYCIRTPRY
jgi:hypothetical protein